MRDILNFVGKIGALSLAFVCLTSSSFTVNAQESSVTSGKIQIDNEKANTNSESTSKSTSNFQSVDSKPYRFSQGQRDPFVPFGGNLAPKPLEPSSDFDIKLQEEAKNEKTVTSKEEKDVADEPIVLPVKATGVLLANDHSFAILAPDGNSKSSAKSSDSFLVGVGDKIGEYTVKSISNDNVVLIWQGKPYNVPVQKYTAKDCLGALQGIYKALDNGRLKGKKAQAISEAKVWYDRVKSLSQSKQKQKAIETYNKIVNK